MKRSKRHRVKQELPETSTSRSTSQKEHDLAYYIHDRVELMHQVFSVLKSKEIKAMAPECVRHISVSDLQELCMEELLGISSKRLCAILDGATPPSDTESSSESEQLETISLDSISSDEEILSQISSKKSKKHKHRSKSKPKKRKSKDNDDEDKDQADRSRRAGLTVLELLELQARARAIRAQLQQEQASAVSTGRPSESVTGNSDDEVEIKEEAAEVVEISSEDEKPNVQKLEERITATHKDSAQDASSNSKTTTKKVNNLIITVPKTNTSRKIKLKRNTSSNSKAVERAPDIEINSKTTSTVVLVEETATSNRKHASKSINQEASTISVDAVTTQNSQSKVDKPTKDVVNAKDKNRSKDKKKKRKKGKQSDKYGSDHDEITLQLSDTEKMDLLEDLDEKKHDECSGTKGSSSDSSDDSVTDDSDEDKHPNSFERDTRNTNLDKDKVDKESSIEIGSNSEPVSIEKNISDDRATKEVEGMLGNKTTLDSNSLIDRVDEQVAEKDNATSNEKDDRTGLCDIDENTKTILEDKNTEPEPTDSAEKENVISDKNAIEISSSHDIPPLTCDLDTSLNVEQSISDLEMQQEQKQREEKSSEVNIENNSEIVAEHINVSDKVLLSKSELTTIDTMSNSEADNANKDNLNEKSEGELSDRDSSEVEASDFKPDVVCISDDEEKKGKKKKKKDKKSKKEKKSKKKKDFRESGDQNFYSEKSNVLNQPNTSENEVVIISEVVENDDSSSKCDNIRENVREKKIIIVSEIEENKSKYQLKDMENLKPEFINTDSDLDDDVYEILELSGDSSCYEVEEISISMEPTAEEIQALSAKVDELERDTVIDNTKIDKESEESDTLSWKERYLKSNKVKKVLTTANIMNAMRKKNLELKKKLQESKKDMEIEEIEKKLENVEEATTNVEDGSIEQYNTLEASTKYVDPVKEANESTDNTDENGSKDKTAEEKNGTKDTVTREMKKDAKQLLKMYKMLLKYNDMTLQKDPNKKKKKKKKCKEKDKSVPVQVTTG